jgi:flagellin
MLQTAEGAYQEITNMMQRMRELGVQGQNGSNGDTELGFINTELQQLLTQINNIATSTKFNGKTMLDGSLTTAVDAASTFTVGFSMSTGTSAAVSRVDVSGAQAGTTYSLTGSGTDLTLSDGTNSSIVSVSALAAEGTQTLDFGSLGVSIEVVAGTGGKTAANIVTDLNGQDLTTAAGSGSITFQVGADNATDNRVSLSFSNAQIVNGGTFDALADALSTINDGSPTNDDFGALITAVDSSLDLINTQRATIGASQNRLEYAISNVNITAENLAAANSRIRDVDVAHESASLSRATVLVQAGTSVLAQANQMSQLALKLLG